MIVAQAFEQRPCVCQQAIGRLDLERQRCHLRARERQTRGHAPSGAVGASGERRSDGVGDRARAATVALAQVPGQRDLRREPRGTTRCEAFQPDERVVVDAMRRMARRRSVVRGVAGHVATPRRSAVACVLPPRACERSYRIRRVFTGATPPRAVRIDVFVPGVAFAWPFPHDRSLRLSALIVRPPGTPPVARGRRRAGQVVLTCRQESRFLMMGRQQVRRRTAARLQEGCEGER